MKINHCRILRHSLNCMGLGLPLNIIDMLMLWKPCFRDFKYSPGLSWPSFPAKLGLGPRGDDREAHGKRSSTRATLRNDSTGMRNLDWQIQTGYAEQAYDSRQIRQQTCAFSSVRWMENCCKKQTCSSMSEFGMISEQEICMQNITVYTLRKLREWPMPA